MRPPIEVRIPAVLSNRLRLALRNLAILLHAELHVRVKNGVPDCIALAANGQEVRWPVPDLDAWQSRAIRIISWRGIDLPQPDGLGGPMPDLVGLAHYLFNDFEELRQEKEYPDLRYDLQHSPFSAVYQSNYLDQALQAAVEPLQLRDPAPRGVILTHDLDILSPRDRRCYPWTFGMAIRWAFQSLLCGRFRDAQVYTLSLYEAFKAAGRRHAVPFEFLDWAQAESAAGFRSVFFVFAPDREKSFRYDAYYTLDDIHSGTPRVDLRTALRQLAEERFLIGPHLSRSADRRRDQIDREFDSLAQELQIPLTATRNHWLWIRYSEWYKILQEKQIDFDFNQATVGYSKGTAFPYYSTNGRTQVFPTTYMDDAVLSKARMFLDEDAALQLCAAQLDTLEKGGGCIALSFHPAEDIPAENFRITNKLQLYRRILEEIRRREIPVYLPAEAREVFHKDVTFDGGM
jgi:hypothetical protein